MNGPNPVWKFATKKFSKSSPRKLRDIGAAADRVDNPIRDSDRIIILSCVTDRDRGQVRAGATVAVLPPGLACPTRGICIRERPSVVRDPDRGQSPSSFLPDQNATSSSLSPIFPFPSQ